MQLLTRTCTYTHTHTHTHTHTRPVSTAIQSLKLIDASEAPDEIGLTEHSLVFKNSITMETRSTEQSELMDRLLQIVCK